MAYGNFDFARVKKEFNLTETRLNLFKDVKGLPMSDWLKESLDIGLYLALASSSEKAKSEFIITPILLELYRRNKQNLALYSGERLDVDSSKGLHGECDFILSKGTISHTIQVPIIALVEAKRHDMKAGLGQCVAQMVGAQLFNQQEENDITTIFGCVTTGEDWQFLKLENDIISIDIVRYYIDNVEKIQGILQSIADFYDD